MSTRSITVQSGLQNLKIRVDVEQVLHSLEGVTIEGCRVRSAGTLMDREISSLDENDDSSAAFVGNTDVADGDRRANVIWHTDSERFDGS